jgi:hypothetical protein
LIGGIGASGCDSDGACAEVSGAGDVVGCVADDDELRGRERELEMRVEARGGEGGKVASVVRVFAERAGEREESGESDEAQLPVCRAADVAGEKRREVARVRLRRFQNFARAGQSEVELLALIRHALKLGDEVFAQFRTSRTDLLGREAFAAERFAGDLEIGHAGDVQLVELPRSPEDANESGRRVVLEDPASRGAHERPVDVPEQHARI